MLDALERQEGATTELVQHSVRLELRKEELLAKLRPLNQNVGQLQQKLHERDLQVADLQAENAMLRREAGLPDVDNLE